MSEYIYQQITKQKILNSQIEIVKINQSEEKIWQIDFLLLLLHSIRQIRAESNASEYYLELLPEWKKKLNPHFNFNQFLEPLTKSKVFFLEKEAVFNSAFDLPPFGVLKYQKSINLENKKKALEKQQGLYHQEYQKNKKLVENPHFLHKASPVAVAKAKEKLVYYQKKEREVVQELEKLKI